MTRVLPSKTAMRKTLAISLAVHGALFAVVGPLGRGSASASALAPPEDRWTGTTAELPFAAGNGGPLYDVSVDRAPPALPLPSPPPPPLPAAPAPPAAPDLPASPPAPPLLAAAPAPPRRQKPAPRTKDRPHPDVSASTSAAPIERRAPGRSPALAARAGAPGGGGSAGGSFGSEGPASVRDLGRALTRAIPPACDADPVWASLPIGPAGKLEVVVHIDESGHITGAEPRGAVQPRALVNILRRTIPLLQAGTFAVREGATAAGDEILELSATVSDASDASGAPNQLAFEYARGKGKARFTQSSGRHVEVGVRVVRIEIAR